MTEAEDYFVPKPEYQMYVYDAMGFRLYMKDESWSKIMDALDNYKRGTLIDEKKRYAGHLEWTMQPVRNASGETVHHVLEEFLGFGLGKRLVVDVWIETRP